MAPRVGRIVRGRPTPLRNNALQGHAAMPARFLAG